MKAITITLLKTALFIFLLTASASATAQSANSIKQEPKSEVITNSIDTVLVTKYFTEKQTQPGINKNALIRGYRKVLRRQKDLYLIPWELRKKHFRIC
ncbi:hypothetical protein [Flavobacterium psychrotrophum]|uniref:hypothetical protein n=1 Tax=Flavobacterium psychrotrophum TaxID=2294119 RepID=UPI000E30B755|nr:hypothetical protein [Flavobacterium psychrotrophum]